jgi:uncharacterized membrane protein
VRYETSVEINAGPGLVWAVLIDLERWPHWTGSMRTVQILDDGPVAVGSAVRIEQPRLRPAVWRVTDLRQGRSFTWVSRIQGVTTEATHDVHPASGGDTATATLTLRQYGWLSGPVGMLTAGMVRDYLHREAEGLKHWCELQ